MEHTENKKQESMDNNQIANESIRCKHCNKSGFVGLEADCRNRCAFRCYGVRCDSFCIGWEVH